MTPELQSQINQLTDGITALPGWCTTAKATYMAQMILEQKPRLVVELGVFGGRSFLPMALALKANGPTFPGLAIGIDPWSTEACVEGMDHHDADDRANIDWWSKVDLHDVHRRAQAAIDAFSLWHHACLLQGRAEKIAEINSFSPGSIDFLHFDQNHSETTSCRDIALWLPLCRPGATLVFDDSDWPSTAKALAIVDRSCTLIEDFTKHRVYRKNKA